MTSRCARIAPNCPNAQRILAEEAARREALFQQSVAAEQNRGDALSKRFEEALSRRSKEPITKPTRDFDLRLRLQARNFSSRHGSRLGIEIRIAVSGPNSAASRPRPSGVVDGLAAELLPELDVARAQPIDAPSELRIGRCG